MKPTTKEAISLLASFVAMFILGLVVAVALGYLDNPLLSFLKAPPVVVQVECHNLKEPTEVEGEWKKSIEEYYWSDGTKTLKWGFAYCATSFVN